jgi:hypothetical protein
MKAASKKLATTSKVEQRLASAKTVADFKEIQALAESVRQHAKKIGMKLKDQNYAARVKIEAEQGAGRLIGEMPKIGHRPRKGNTLIPFRKVIAEAGILPMTAHRWQAETKMTRETLLQREAELTEKGEELTSAFVYHEVTGGTHLSQNTGESEWYSPEDLVEAARQVMGEIDLDPASCAVANKVIKAARFYSEEDDGLSKVWKGRVWMNPPYSQPLVAQFGEKLIESFQAGTVAEAITLTNNCTEVAWLQSLLRVASALCFPSGRVRFWYPGRKRATPLQGQVVAYLGPHPAVFIERFHDFGATSGWRTP